LEHCAKKLGTRAALNPNSAVTLAKKSLARRILLNSAKMERKVTQFVNDNSAVCNLETTSEA